MAHITHYQEETYIINSVSRPDFFNFGFNHYFRNENGPTTTEQELVTTVVIASNTSRESEEQAEIEARNNQINEEVTRDNRINDMITGFQQLEDNQPIQGDDVFWNNNNEFNVNELIEYTGEGPENLELSPGTNELLHDIDSLISPQPI